MRWFSFRRKSCENIDAVFVYGPVRCSILTRRRRVYGRHIIPICNSHHME